jgi:superfamily II DNA/RNA helicase
MSYHKYSTGNRNGRFSSNNRSQNHRSSSRIKKEKIESHKFIKAAQAAEIIEYKNSNWFEDFAIHPKIKSNLKQNNFQKPTAIQDKAIPAALADKDILGIANTGTGKTAAFAIPVIHKIMTCSDKYTLIMAPTRELAEQIDDNFKVIAAGSGILGVLLIGGTAIGPQLRTLRSDPRVVIGTPGRIKDHFERGTLDLSKFNLVVLDEVDRMLDMGFINDITLLLKNTPVRRQLYFFSATFDTKVQTIVKTFSSDFVQISVKQSETSDNVDQNIVKYSSGDDKLQKLHDLLVSEKVSKALVFDDTHHSVDKLSNELKLRGLSVDTIHGGKSQAQRQRALRNFKEDKIKILVATDVAARGIDVLDISHVINYSTPHTYGDYVHRIGRTGRAGKTGFALTFISNY